MYDNLWARYLKDLWYYLEGEMKKPIPGSGTWSTSKNSEQIHMSAVGSNKKFKRKSREPKRLLTESTTTFPVDVSDSDSVDEAHMVTQNVSKLAPLQRQLMMSQELLPCRRGLLSALPEDSMAVGQSGAIDMRIGINIPANGARVSQSLDSPSSNHEISHWPPSISQPLSQRLKVVFPLTSASGSCSPGHQAFPLDHGLPDQSAVLTIPRASQSSRCLERMEVQLSSPKDSPRKRTGISGDAQGHLPEVKAIQQTRRLLANARERTRVHTISAAFEALRKQVPCYSYGQKLSKLAILRIACNYILSLAQLAELDYSSDRGSVSFSQCVDQCTRTLQAEGRSKKRKE